ncbi:MAG: DUF433 domain-containing protein [Verrucomicrobiota bacterium]
MIERIVIDPDVCHGQPCIRGTRVMVSNILNLLSNGAAIEEVLEAYPQLRREDIYAALSYAESIVKDEEVILTGV